MFFWQNFKFIFSRDNFGFLLLDDKALKSLIMSKDYSNVFVDKSIPEVGNWVFSFNYWIFIYDELVTELISWGMYSFELLDFKTIIVSYWDR